LFLCCCWLGHAVCPATAQDAAEAGPGSIRILKGVTWLDEWQPPDADAAPRMARLKGTRWADPPRPRSAPATEDSARPTAGTSLGGDSAAPPLFPKFDLPAVERARPVDARVDLFQAPARPEPQAPHVNVLVLPAIIQPPAREGWAGGNEASEAHLTSADEGSAARRSARAASRDEQTAGSPAATRAPQVCDRPPPESSVCQSALIHFASTAAGVVVALALSFAGLLVLRRLGVPLPIGWQQVPAAAPAVAPPAERISEPVTDFDRVPNFDLGPTYAEEARQREAAAHEQERAVLRQIFEQNVLLREQIGALDEPTETAAPREE
jgi:hypothetical protein